ncbi:M61 family metallopeptidase [Thiolapillus brandeum]|uniref:Peptidase M61 family protein n=1 Tax=Thiolapillus brandeum TaxID=1076588 RepID=A0A7U6JL46_9GAMM|nr:PDZ domain-containing protein [Thiolapillus brandeum]BAO45565.1 peptidase M61 family protein [Thiolapillus brandeum]
MADLIEYHVSPFHPEAHLFRVTLIVPEPDSQGQKLVLPAWIPGSYMIRDFARNIVSVSASCDGTNVDLIKLDKHSWQVAPVKGRLQVQTEVYAWDLSVRGAHLDTSHGFFNGTSLFLRVVGQEARPIKVMLNRPSTDLIRGWRLATSMPPKRVDKEGFGVYEVDNYEQLLDYPVEMGDFTETTFESKGIPHRMVFTGHVIGLDTERLCRDMQAICTSHADLFGELPLKQYLFMTMVTGDGYGGLEHGDSTALMCKRDDLPFSGMGKMTRGYRNFLGLCSHEYFHLWNVKRIRPRVLKDADLSDEVHTELLWAFEGITSYYDDLALVRSGCIDADSYLELLATTATRVMRGRGRLRQSVAESSFDTWTRFYKQDENAPNAIVSYYSKGALAALGLDITLRDATDDRSNLDDFMGALWRDFGKTDHGVDEGDLEKLAADIAGRDLNEFFQRVVHGREELPLEEWFRFFGIGYRLRAARGPDDWGSSGRSDDQENPRHSLGARYRQKGDFVELLQVYDEGPAQQCGLSAGDRLVAMDGVQVTSDNLASILNRLESGTQVEVHAFRRDELMNFQLSLCPPMADTCELWLLAAEECTALQLQRRRQWLRQ